MIIYDCTRRIYRLMAGRFEGLTDLEWKLFDDVFPQEPSKRGKEIPHPPYRHVCEVSFH